MHIFTALLSSKNEIFKNYIQVYKDQWEDDEPILANDIIARAKSKYANLTKSTDWGKNDPKQTQLLALMTKVEKLEGNKTSQVKREEIIKLHLQLLLVPTTHASIQKG